MICMITWNRCKEISDGPTWKKRKTGDIAAGSLWECCNPPPHSPALAGFSAEPRKLLILRGWTWPFGCWQSTPYLSVVPWSYSEKYSGKVRYLPQFCSQLSELIDRPNKLLFSASMLECLPRPTNGEKKNSWD